MVEHRSRVATLPALEPDEDEAASGQFGSPRLFASEKILYSTDRSGVVRQLAFPDDQNLPS